ncbi:CPBP family intramembrane metalloprotease [Leptospira levettii]|uniref:CPBP family intramembrane glutamic endopeptidase n=1 Tax=Leptospira levettii TaxID=2023178 RepID=UPI0010830012|nr:type II CAAX endopeptidase family protein [Leptospira levettii]TGM42000.1 CPBP family intramembrane metalloprotease [Leptospira levettii]TGM70829.1 CPBP family intramembrane metalloprotease [Leptospira levettii]
MLYKIQIHSSLRLNPMQTSKKFTYFFALVISVSFIISFFLYGIQNSIAENNPQIELKPFSYSKILSRTTTVILFFSLLWFYKRIEKKPIRSLGLENISKRKKNLFLGFLAGMASLSFVVATKVIFGVSTWEPKEFLAFDYLISFYFLLSVFCIGFVEELFFRGYLLQSFVVEWGEKKAAIFTSLFFSITHFIRPMQDILILIPEFIGLFLVGYALSYAWIYTRSLYLPIGIHAGWVYVVKMQSFFVSPIPHDYHLLFGGERLVTGFISWMFMFLFLFGLKRFFEQMLQKDQMPTG